MEYFNYIELSMGIIVAAFNRVVPYVFEEKFGFGASRRVGPVECSALASTGSFTTTSPSCRVACRAPSTSGKQCFESGLAGTYCCLPGGMRRVFACEAVTIRVARSSLPSGASCSRLVGRELFPYDSVWMPSANRKRFSAKAHRPRFIVVKLNK